MVVNLMKNSSPHNAVNKVVTNVMTLDVMLKNPTDVLNPTIIVVGTGVTGYNYAQIPDFGRYYFLGEPITRNENTVEIELSVDPLFSFAGEIRANSGVVDRNANIINNYLADPEQKELAYKRIQTKAFPNSFETNGNLVLIVTGGV